MIRKIVECGNFWKEFLKALFIHKMISYEKLSNQMNNYAKILENKKSNLCFDKNKF